MEIIKIKSKIMFNLFLLLIIIINARIFSLKCMDCRTLPNGQLL